MFHLDPGSLAGAVRLGAFLRNDPFQAMNARRVQQGFAVLERLGCSPGRPVQLELIEEGAAVHVGKAHRVHPVDSEHVENREREADQIPAVQDALREEREAGRPSSPTTISSPSSTSPSGIPRSSVRRSVISQPRRLQTRRP